MKKLYEEIIDLQNDISHRSAVRIFSILDNNKEYFSSKIEKDVFEQIRIHFEELAYNHPGKQKSVEFIQEYSRLMNSLLYQINRF